MPAGFCLPRAGPSVALNANVPRNTPRGFQLIRAAIADLEDLGELAKLRDLAREQWGDDPQHADHAVAAALDMLEALDALNARWRAEGRPPVDIGIGINSGEMIAGNIGSAAIMSYTVIGDAVNLGARLESATKDHDARILIIPTLGVFICVVAPPTAERTHTGSVPRLGSESPP